MNKHALGMLPVFALTASFCCFAPAGAQTAPAKIHVAAIPIDTSAAVYYALDLGLFKKRNLDVDVQSMASGAAIAPAVSSGSVDIGSANFISLAQAHERGIPFVMVAPAGAFSAKSPATQLIVATSSSIRAAKDLSGKTIGVASLNNIGALTVLAWTAKNGGDAKSLKFVEVPQAQMGASVAAGRIDAAEISEPFLSDALDHGARALAADSAAISPEFVEGGYFAMADYVRANTDAVRRFDSAIDEAGAWANKNQAAAAEILSKYSKRPPAKSLYHTIFPERFKASDAQPLIDAAARFGELKKAFPSAEMMASGVFAQ